MRTWFLSFGRVYNTLLFHPLPSKFLASPISIPSKISKNNSFLFQENEVVLIKIEDDSLIISKNDELSKIVKNFVNVEYKKIISLFEM